MRIILLGVTGYTGRLIAAELKKRDISFIPAGRNLEKLQALQSELALQTRPIVVDTESEEQVAKLVGQGDVIINCVGPYNLFGREVLKQSVAQGKTYLDLTGEQSFVYNSFVEHSRQAEKTGARILHSMAFESCLADFLAAEICDFNREYIDISSYYSFRHSRPSPGTRLTMQFARHFPTFCYREGERVELAPLSYDRDFRTEVVPGINRAIFMPYPEVFFFANSYKTLNTGSYLLASEGGVGMLKAQGETPKKSKEKILERHQKRTFQGPTEAERWEQEFTLIVVARPRQGETQTISLKGRDMYGLTAQIILLSVELLERDSSSGVLCPHQVFNSGEFLNRLSQSSNLSLVRG